MYVKQIEPPSHKFHIDLFHDISSSDFKNITQNVCECLTWQLIKFKQLQVNTASPIQCLCELHLEPKTPSGTDSQRPVIAASATFTQAQR